CAGEPRLRRYAFEGVTGTAGAGAAFGSGVAEVGAEEAAGVTTSVAVTFPFSACFFFGPISPLASRVALRLTAATALASAVLGVRAGLGSMPKSASAVASAPKFALMKATI